MINAFGEVMVNEDFIKNKMKELNLTQRSLAQKMGIFPERLNLKLKNKAPLYIQEIFYLKNLLNISQIDDMICFKKIKI